MAGDKDPKNMGVKLKTGHKSRCIAAELTRRRKILTLKMGNGDTVRRYVKSILTIAHEMSYAGKVLSDDDKKYALLNGLRTEFYVMIMILQENLADSFESLVASFELTEDELKQSGKIKSGASSSIFVADSNGAVKKVPCFICSKKGHKMAN